MERDFDIPLEVKLAYMQRDIDILKIQMSELKVFAERASNLFHQMTVLQNQLEGFDNRLDEKLELFSLKLESKLNKEIQDVKHTAIDKKKDDDDEAPPKEKSGLPTKEIALIIIYIIVFIAATMNVKLPTL